LGREEKVTEYELRGMREESGKRDKSNNRVELSGMREKYGKKDDRNLFV